MKKRTNLALAAFLLGGIATTLPTIGKIIVFTGIALLLFFNYDEFSYNHDHKQTAGGAE
ncbi:hypothetical protein [Enterococcus avium]|uniref:hypothetical protein n=1 Tax=Enterococcus avium TaxID=33945 RepID=UPI001C10C2CD|nr:hypothetical protein [Enterococcus avium]MBU5369599.1 hypothetical protein [Enterococcus avium]MDT2422086.1 hypothetical protein [Enterococcus avium]